MKANNVGRAHADHGSDQSRVRYVWCRLWRVNIDQVLIVKELVFKFMVSFRSNISSQELSALYPLKWIAEAGSFEGDLASPEAFVRFGDDPPPPEDIADPLFFHLYFFMLAIF